MAYTPCTAALAANITPSCDNPLVGGLTGRAVGIPLSPAPTLTRNAQNSRVISDVTLVEGEKTFAIVNFGEQPFADTASASSADSGSIKHTKTFAFDVPKRGADASKNIIDPLVRLPRGFMVIAERIDTNGDASYIVYGAEQGLRVNADGVTSNEYERDGATHIVASCQQANYEYSFFDTDLATTQAKFEALLTTNSL